MYLYISFGKGRQRARVQFSLATRQSLLNFICAEKKSIEVMKHQEKKISKDIPKDDINLLEKGRNPREHQES